MQRPGHPYASASYATALRHIGRPIELTEWDGFVLARPITTGSEDACGPYPLTVIPRTADIHGGLEKLATLGMVSLVIVPDPLASPEVDRLAKAFDVCRPFKRHAVIDLTRLRYDPTKHHRDRIRRALRRCTIDIEKLSDHMGEWDTLYSELGSRREISSQAKFDTLYFEYLAQDENFVCFSARCDNAIVAMTIWFEANGIAYSHLTASNMIGYKNGAIYALNDAAISHFGGTSIINLGGGSGLGGNEADGLFEFKKGFANDEVEAFICGAIIDLDRYRTLSANATTTYFPAYRYLIQST